MTTTNIGVPTGGKPINLRQLEGELGTAGVTVNALGMGDDLVYTYDSEGVPADLPAGSDAVIDAHVAMRDKTDAELSAEFQATTDPARRQEIRDMQAGLIPREQVPM